jgi:hypothetical protein
MFLQPYFQCYESLGRGWLRTRCPQAHKSSHWRSIYSSPLGGWMADPPTMIPAAQRRWEIFASRSTNASDGGIKPETSGSCSVSSAPSHIASQRVKGARRTFQRGRPSRCFTGDVLLLKLSCNSGTSHVRKRRRETHCLQVSQT